MKLKIAIRTILYGIFGGIFLSWAIGDELIGMIICAIILILNELFFKFALGGISE